MIKIRAFLRWLNFRTPTLLLFSDARQDEFCQPCPIPKYDISFIYKTEIDNGLNINVVLSNCQSTEGPFWKIFKPKMYNSQGLIFLYFLWAFFIYDLLENWSGCYFYLPDLNRYGKIDRSRIFVKNRLIQSYNLYYSTKNYVIQEKIFWFQITFV